MARPSFTIEDLDFNFENSPTKLVATKSSPEIKVAGETVGPLEEGQEFQVKFWVALELVKAGIARFHEDQLDLTGLNKLYWIVNVQTGTRISSLPENFYPKLRRYLAELRESTDPPKLQEYEKATRIVNDIVNCRLRKIVGLASSPPQTDEVLRNLSEEERILYTYIYGIVADWRKKILNLGAPSE